MGEDERNEAVDSFIKRTDYNHDTTDSKGQ